MHKLDSGLQQAGKIELCTTAMQVVEGNNSGMREALFEGDPKR
jgi:hypothetical protein